MTNSALSGQRPGLVIAVDGPAGSGKSSAAREVARSLGLRYLDTGAMYRALTWWLLATRVDIGSAAAVAAQLPGAQIEIGTDPDAPAISVGGTDVSGPIRTREVSNAVSAVAAVPQVRAYLIAMQREIIARAVAAGEGIVAEGRDVGTVVAPCGSGQGVPDRQRGGAGAPAQRRPGRPAGSHGGRDPGRAGAAGPP